MTLSCRSRSWLGEGGYLPHGWRAWLTGCARSGALGYGFLLFPLGVVTGEPTLIGWSTGLAAIHLPA